jgi:hypothetical protein
MSESDKERIAEEVNSLIYSGEDYSIDDLIDIVGDGDPLEYI